MKTKKISLFIFLLTCVTIFAPVAIGQQSLPPGHDLKVFKELLAGINASFTFPDNFTEAKPSNSDKFAYQYALQLPNADFEIRFQVNSLKDEWKNFDPTQKEKTNPDSLYTKQAVAVVKSLAGEGHFFIRNIPSDVLGEYNADLGRSYFINLANSAETNHYQYALFVVIQKNHYGNVMVACFGNERGPEFFKNINKIKDCLKFNN